MMREWPCKPYLIVEHSDGVELRESVTGFRVRRRLFSEAMGEMHRQLIERREALGARADLSAPERQELDGLVAKFPERFLRDGLRVASGGARP